MTLPNDSQRRFVKHVVRRATIVARAAATASASAAQNPKKPNAIAREQTSSLKASAVAILLGSFLGVFLLFVLVGITCKYANRPRSDTRPHGHAKAMYQPSAAGYGSAAAGYSAAASMQDVSSPNVGLLDSAQPMGRGGPHDDGDDSLGSSNATPPAHAALGAIGTFGMIPSNSAGSFSGDDPRRFGPARTNGHARGASSGIELPGPAASATFRRNVSGSHPPIPPHSDDSYDSPQPGYAVASGSILPDGSGFTPGQLFDHNAINGGAPKASSEMREHRSSYLRGDPGVLPRRASLVRDQAQQRSYLRGPPPSSSKNRRSRYHQNQPSTDSSAMRRSRIDSVGPGTYRKSMFLPEGESAEFANGSQIRRTTSRNNDGSDPKPLRRVESIGKGEARRASRYTPTNGSSRNPASVMPEDYHMPPAAHRDGGSSNGSVSPLGPLGPNDATYTMEQQQQQQQQYVSGDGVRMPYGAGFGGPTPRPSLPTTQISSPSLFASAAPLGAGLGGGMQPTSYAASRQIF